MTSSETSVIRHEAVNYCVGKGIDIGFGGDKIKSENCIGFDLNNPYTKVGSSKTDEYGDARNMWMYEDETFDYVYSSHLLEDFVDTENVVLEWLRILKLGGNLVLYLPNEILYQKHCKDYNIPYNKAHKHKNMDITYILNILNKHKLKILMTIPKHSYYSFFVAAKKIAPCSAPQKIYSAAHSGDLGDIVYAIPTMKKLRIGKLFLDYKHPNFKTKFDVNGYNNICHLLNSQGIETLFYGNNDVVDYDLNAFRYTGQDLSFSHLAVAQARAMNVDVDMSKPWLSVEPIYETDIIIHRSPRYHNPVFNWEYLLYDVFDKATIGVVGYPDEAEAMQKLIDGPVKYIFTNNLLETARIIAGAKVFIGNQSVPFAIAEGLKVNRIQETVDWVPNASPLSRNGKPVINVQQLKMAKEWLINWIS